MNSTEELGCLRQRVKRLEATVKVVSRHLAIAVNGAGEQKKAATNTILAAIQRSQI